MGLFTGRHHLFHWQYEVAQETGAYFSPAAPPPPPQPLPPKQSHSIILQDTDPGLISNYFRESKLNH